MKPLFTFSSNSIRLSLVNWICVSIILMLVVSLLPIIWRLVESFNPSDDYRIPYELSNDYWMFSRWCRYTSSNYPILIIGDSVVWGQYVGMQETLPHYLNESENSELFANLGVDGIHPVAMLGLVKYYGKAISNKGVILHLNPLWMSSKKHDLSDVDEFRFNHPRLVPQFYPKIASYKASFSHKMNIVVERNVPFSSWVSHIRSNCYENMDIGNWTMQYPYRDPITAITLQIPYPENKPHSEPISWMERGMTKQDFQWVSADESFQWASFRKTIKLLQARKNRVFVIVGPFNPYILTNESLDRYKAMKKDMENWLKDNEISYASIPDLPSEYYADASHPLKEGYAMIANELVKTEPFENWLAR